MKQLRQCFLVQIGADDAEAAGVVRAAGAHINLAGHVVKLEPFARGRLQDALGAEHSAVLLLIPELAEEDDPKYNEDDFGNLTFLDSLLSDETTPENNVEDVAYEEITDELSDILSQADELVAHPVPATVITVEQPEIDSVEEVVEEVPQETFLEEEETTEESTEDASTEEGTTEEQSTQTGTQSNIKQRFKRNAKIDRLRIAIQKIWKGIN